jgi:hypothetical protein
VRPVDGLVDAIQPDTTGGDLLTDERRLRVLAPRRIRRVEDQTAREGVLSRCREEAVDVGLLNRVAPRIKFTLRRADAALANLRDDVDARIRLGLIVLLCPIRIQPDLAELLLHAGILPEERDTQLLEIGALGPLTRRIEAQMAQDGP